MKMKILTFIWFCTILGASTSFAQAPSSPEPAPAFTDLKGVMKAMGADFKLLGLQIKDATQNESSLALCTDFAALIVEAQKFLPLSIAKFPTEDQSIETQKYHQMILELSQATAELIAALKANDDTATVTIFNKIRAMKMSGHSLFDPKP